MWHGGGDEGRLVNVGGPLKRESREVSHSSASIMFMPIFHYSDSFLTCNQKKKNTHTPHIPRTYLCLRNRNQSYVQNEIQVDS